MNSIYTLCKNVLFYVINTFLLFMFIYQIKLSTFGVPEQLISPRLAAICFIIFGFLFFFHNLRIRNRIYSPHTSKEFRKYVIIMLLLAGYGLILYITIGIKEGDSFLVTMANICLFSIPVTWILTKIYRGIDDFMISLVLVGIAQSVIIITCLVDNSFAALLDFTFNDTYSPDLRGGYAGGLSCIAAPGVIRYSISLIAVCYLYVKYKKVYLLLLFVFFAVIVTMIARTGVLIDVICTVFIIACSANSKVLIRLAIPTILIVFVLYLLVDSGNYSDFLSERYNRMNELKESGLRRSFFDGYFSGSYIPLELETLFGVGVVSGRSGNGYLINVDGGFLRIYSAIGLIFSICIYAYLFRMILKTSSFFVDRMKKYYIWLFFVFFAIADFKEITFFLVYPMCIFFVSAILMEREQSYLKIQSNNRISIKL